MTQLKIRRHIMISKENDDFYKELFSEIGISTGIDNLLSSYRIRMQEKHNA